MKPIRPLCVATCKQSGHPCLRRATAHSTFCAVHEPGAKLAGAAIRRPEPTNNIEHLQRLLTNKNPKIILGAISLMEKLRDDKKLADWRPSWVQWYRGMNDEERAEQHEITMRSLSLKFRFARRRPDLVPDGIYVPRVDPMAVSPTSSETQATRVETPETRIAESSAQPEGETHE